jgi:hypothetical protein
VYDAGSAFAAAIVGRHVPRARLTALDDDGSIREVWEDRSAVLLDGTAGYDRTRHVRRACAISLANPTGSLSPQRPGDLFFGGARLLIERGVVVGRGVAWAPTFSGIVTSFRAGMDGRLDVAGEDPFALLAQPMGDVVSIEDGMRASDAIAQLWEPVLEPLVGAASGWTLDDAGRVVARRSWTEDDERLRAGVELMADLGLEVFADRRGVPVLRPIPDPTTATTVRTFRQVAGEASMVDLSRSGSSRPYNRSIAISESPDRDDFRGVAEVTDPSSPVHRDRIGLQTGPIHRSAQMPDQAATNAVALARLVEFALYQDAVGGSAIPDPTLDEGDVVTFVDPVSGANDRYRLDRVTHPVTQGAMALEATKVLPLFSSAA